jgi:hypothetical protein
MYTLLQHHHHYTAMSLLCDVVDKLTDDGTLVPKYVRVGS